MSLSVKTVPTEHPIAKPHRAVPRLPRTRDEVFAAATVVVTLLSIGVAVAGWYDAGAVVALAAVVLGGWSQLISETRMERFESVIAVVAAAVVLATCLAFGSGIWT